MINLRYPNITGATPHEQLVQVKNYMHQLVDQLQFALNAVEMKDTTVVTSSPASAEPQKPTLLDGQVAFNALKPFIIKSADIVNAYYEEINRRLEGEYVAESNFGTFKETTAQSIEANSTEIEQVYTNIQEIITNIENLDFKLAEVNAHIKSGVVSTDANGLPIYGLEIGQTNTIDGEEVFNKYARFTSDRLSFYDKNDSEVAYISGYKLYITHAEVTGTLKLGGYLVDTTHGLTFKWVGRG